MRQVYYHHLKPKIYAAHGERYGAALDMIENGHFRSLRSSVKDYSSDVRLAIRECAFFYRSHERFDLVNYLIELDRADEQEEALKILGYIPRENWNEVLFQVAGFALIELSEFEKSLELLDSMPSRIKWDRHHYCIKLKALDRLGRFRASLETFAEMPPEIQKFKPIVELVAKAHYILGEFELGLERLDSLPMDKRDKSVNFLAANLRNELKIKIQCEKAQICIAEKRYKSALDELARLRHEQWNTDVHNLAASVHLATGEYRKALIILESLPKSEWNNRSREIVLESWSKLKED
ncbi:hypothetical protein AMJ44_10625 [candidate division WOR-1 bacterium DG_54_3]|uniref:Tetratricopeptide repeat protein n=1 Tax=candidate division WOR-1 bacterium DG_54_3 TaxID=1703775 RepID=A0A0S7XS37_UNCSA|nr:MAG: hypothetical protein AMJ44_10625 [candidate division WOR-1 bacterium DG_54_3]